MSFPLIHVVVIYPDGQKNEQSFQRSFRLGRDLDNELHISDPSVSRNHAEVVFLADSWWIRDAHSANGIYLNGAKVDRHPLSGSTEVALGEGGVRLVFRVEEQQEEAVEEKESRTVADYQDYYFGDEDDEDIGERTMMVRKAFKVIQKKQKRRYGGVIAVITCLFVLAGSFAIYKDRQVQKQTALAAEIFYTIKSLDLEFADLLETAREKTDEADLKKAEQLLAVAREKKDKVAIKKAAEHLSSVKERRDDETVAKVARYKEKKKKLEKNYSKFIEVLGVYKKDASIEDKLIFKVARDFGECELFIPEDFSKEVHRYIEKWKTTKRYANAIGRAKKKGYSRPIAQTMMLYDLPPQFFYLALQESNFNINACGPKTRWGIAKGMWQFIPGTARDFGLKTGPLAKVKKPDPKDDRHNFTKSTMAAAKYLSKIYNTDAQASGLLVMASYNWGHNRVNRLIRDMPHNPKDRNFWKFFENYRDKIPKETYDYVFYIFSAAVIGENPRHFGFDFENPLGFVDSFGG